MFPFNFRKKRYTSHEIEPDEVFLDSRNLPEFDTQQMEGRIEKPISKRSVFFFGIACICLGLIFTGRLVSVQIVQGSDFFERSESNSLNRIPLFADRGVIYDRNGVELAWNQNVEGIDHPLRHYIKEPGFSSFLGSVSYPSKDSKGNYWKFDIEGKEGIEKEYNTHLAGTNGSKLFETDVRGVVRSENTIEPALNGDNLTLTVDARIQAEFARAIASLAERSSFVGGAGVIMDVQNGEILAMTSFPEYDSEVLSQGNDRQAINSYLTDPRKPFLNRVIDGLYTPGSIVKPFIALGVLDQNLIDPNKQILSTGSIEIQNPYNPSNKTIFRDWKAHGYVDMREAIAVSSNVYFYTVGGGFGGQKGLGITNIEHYIRLYGLGEPTGIELSGERTGVIPSPVWKKKFFPKDPTWRLGDTYNTSIGQYGFQVTPIQMVRSTAALANGGELLTPHLVRDSLKESPTRVISVEPEDLEVIHEGMRMVVTEGTAGAINSSLYPAAAKTGTAQVGLSKQYVNSWAIGFFPYENPRYAFTVLMERAPKDGVVGAVHAIKPVLDYMAANAPEYLE